jgi:hypothetical protein
MYKEALARKPDLLNDADEREAYEESLRRAEGS